MGVNGAAQLSERLELSARAALAAVGALVAAVGAFLSPHLADILALLLRSGLVQAKGPATKAAAQVREQLPAVVPARLLLPALFSHLDAAFKASRCNQAEHCQNQALTRAASHA